MNKNSINLKQDPEFTIKVISEFIAGEVEKYNFNGGIIALSGGLDSSFVSIISHQALNGNIKLLFIPYGENTEAVRDTSNIASILNTPLEVINIKKIADIIFEERNIDSNTRKGNILARLRMNLLFDTSFRDNALVIGTSNKSELLIGYSTWYGDSAAGIMPIGDLYKTQIRNLSKYLNIPENIINKPPSAELWENQTDEGEIGISYEELDKILYLYVDKRYNENEIIKIGFDEALVKKVINKTKKALFKLKTPPICKVSDRTIGVDYRYNKETIIDI